MSIEADKTKPESVMVYTLQEIHIVPGTNEVIMRGTSNDPEVKRIFDVVDVQDKVNNLPQDDLDGYNNFFRRIFADLCGVDPTEVTGEVFTKSI